MTHGRLRPQPIADCGLRIADSQNSRIWTRNGEVAVHPRPLAFPVFLALAVAIGGARAGETTRTFEKPRLAGISGFRSLWDTPVVLDANGPTEVCDQGRFGKGPRAVWAPGKRGGGARPGAIVFDAVHRSLLVRFPGSARAIAETIVAGRAVRKVELLLTFRGTEYWPEGYILPSGMSFLGDRWVKTPPRWHAVAWALRRPWVADAKLGPTYNAWIHGSAYWAKFGARDERRDRFAHRFGPVEVSRQQALGQAGGAAGGLASSEARPAKPARLDVTASLTDAAYGKTLADRLRRLEDCGFLVRKWESHDIRYKDGWSGYEWGTTTGGRGILIDTPKLVVTFGPAGKAQPAVKLPAPADVAALAGRLRGGRGGRPTAVMCSEKEFNALAGRFGFVRPAWMNDWQWKRVQELYALGKKNTFDQFPVTYEDYGKWLDRMLSIAPRHFFGHITPRRAAMVLRTWDALPEVVREHERSYWRGWLLPHLPHTRMVHPQDAKSQEAFYRRTRDWRGNTSFYRAGYTRSMSTMNFNHTSAEGALLGGSLIGSAHAMADGRSGLETYPLRLWAWYDGTTQESIDHYYFAITLFAQKDYADFGPTPLDRLMGRSMLAKSVDELCSAFHPGLRHFVSSSTRTGPAYLFVIQEGTHHIVHTLSAGGVLHDIGNERTSGMPITGHDAPSDQVAWQSLPSPWAPTWMAHYVDDKPLPYEMTNA